VRWLHATRLICALSMLLICVASAERSAAQAGNVLIVDMQRVLEEAAAASQLRQIERRDRQALRREMDALTAAFEDEEAALTELRDRVDRGEIDRQSFDERVQAFDRRVRAARQRAQEQSVAFQNRFAEAFSALEKEAVPVIDALMVERGAAVALDRRTALVVASGADITDEVIAELDRVLPAAQAEGLLPPEPAPR
jgi:Skp family chaperone for outer membrane proteins